MSSNARCQGRVDGAITGDTVIDIEWSNADASGEMNAVDLSAGDNTLSVPANIVAITITPPAANTQRIILKGAAGDTGIKLSLTQPSVIAVPDDTDIILNAAGTVTGVEVALL